MKNVPLTFVEKVFITLSGLGIVWMFVYSFYMYPTLPETIPTHYNFQGEPDAYGNKGNVWFIPSVAFLLFGVITLLSRFPNLFHYPVEVTEENEAHLYKTSRLMLHMVSFELIAFFSYDTFVMMEGAQGNKSMEGNYSIIALFVVIAMTLGFFMVRSIRLKE